MMLSGPSQKIPMVIISSQGNKIDYIKKNKGTAVKFTLCLFYFILKYFPTLSMYEMKKGGNTFDE